MSMFKKATREKIPLRMIIVGPAGSGKTFTALRLAHILQGQSGGQIAAIGAGERGRLQFYLGESPDGTPFEFDVVDLDDYGPKSYIDAILDAGQSRYSVLIIDGLSPEWRGIGGILEMVDDLTSKSRSKNAYTEGWRHATPLHQRMLEAMLRSPCHIIATARAEMETVLNEVEDERGNKKKIPVKVGLGAVQRKGIEYEFDVFAEIDISHTISISKTRCSAIDPSVWPPLQQIRTKPGREFFAPLIQWLAEGAAPDPSYYLVTEADLVKAEVVRLQREKFQRTADSIEMQSARAAVEAEKPKESVRERIKREAAEREAAGKNSQGEGNGASAAPSATPLAPNGTAAGNGVATGNGSPTPTAAVNRPPLAEATPERIEDYGQQVYADRWADVKAKALRKDGVASLRSLSKERREEILDRLMSKATGLPVSPRQSSGEMAGAAPKN